MTTSATTVKTDFPGYLAGAWTIDPAHSEVGFSVRHLMLSKVKGRFGTFEGQLMTGDDPLASSVEATVDLSSIDTNNPDRDAHLRSSDFFDVEQHPTMTYRSTGIRSARSGFVVDGELSLHGVTRPVSLDLQLEGFLPSSPFGDTRVGFSANGEINRGDFGISFGLADTGGVAVSDKVQITLEVEAVLQAE
jgi:polyisoprenoid-binding protein YceI